MTFSFASIRLLCAAALLFAGGSARKAGAQTTPLQAIPPRTSPVQTAPDPTAPNPAAPNQAAPAQTAPAQTAPAEAHVKGSAASQGTVSGTPPAIEEAPVKSSPGILVDQVVAIVNGDLVLESDVQEEQRFAAFQLYTAGDFSRDTVIERLIDRDLILQQSKLQPDDAVTKADAVKELTALRREIPACKQYHCETDAGWANFVHAQGFTMEELITRWQERMQTLKFIEVRFRSGLQISPAEIKTYYDKTLLPQYAKLHAPAPKLDVISDRVQEILLANQVSNLLGDWLKTLKAEGSVRVIRPGEVQP